MVWNEEGRIQLLHSQGDRKICALEEYILDIIFKYLPPI